MPLTLTARAPPRRQVSPRMTTTINPLTGRSLKVNGSTFSKVLRLNPGFIYNPETNTIDVPLGWTRPPVQRRTRRSRVVTTMVSNVFENVKHNVAAKTIQKFARLFLNREYFITLTMTGSYVNTNNGREYDITDGLPIGSVITFIVNGKHNISSQVENEYKKYIEDIESISWVASTRTNYTYRIVRYNDPLPIDRQFIRQTIYNVDGLSNDHDSDQGKCVIDAIQSTLSGSRLSKKKQSNEFILKTMYNDYLKNSTSEDRINSLLRQGFTVKNIIDFAKEIRMRCYICNDDLEMIESHTKNINTQLPAMVSVVKNGHLYLIKDLDKKMSIIKTIEAKQSSSTLYKGGGPSKEYNIEHLDISGKNDLDKLKYFIEIGRAHV